MGNFFIDVFLKIANRLGLEMQTKQYNDNDFYEVNDISLTATMAERLSTLAIADSSVTVTGSKAAMEILDPVAQQFLDKKLKPTSNTSLGTGDCIVIPITDGEVFDFEIIENNNFAIVESVGDKLLKVIIRREKFVKNNKIFVRFDYQSLEVINGAKTFVIRRYAHVDGKEVPLTSVSEWSNLQAETIIPNVDRLLFGRYKCPTLNRENINSAQGVPITYGQQKTIENAKTSYNRMNEEFRRKETKIFAGKQLFTKDSEKGVVIPDKAVYQLVSTDIDSSTLPIKEFSPDLRFDGLKGNVDFNFKMLELFCGFSSGILTDIQTDLATATAIRASMNNTFAFIKLFQKVLADGTNDLLYAVAMYYNANSKKGVMGDYQVSYDWDYSLMENSTETFNQYLQAYGIGEIKKGEIRAWVKGITQQQAEEDLAEIEEEVIEEAII